MSMHRQGLVREAAEQVFTLSQGQIMPGFPSLAPAEYSMTESHL
jgi:hypothetical protein